jgi:hypothetical protein
MMRATKVDNCGAPVESACSVVTTDGFISVAFSPEIAEGEEIEVRKANGALCISDQSCPELKWVNLEITLCQIDPDFFSFFTGYDLVLDFAGNSVGNRIGKAVQCDQGVALELWSDIPGQVCTTTGQKKYGYFLAPWVVNGILGDFTIENDALSLVINARTQIGSNWGVGPHNVDATNAANTPGPLLTPIGPEQHLDMHVTTIAPPTAVCGCTALVIP